MYRETDRHTEKISNGVYDNNCSPIPNRLGGMNNMSNMRNMNNDEYKSNYGYEDSSQKYSPFVIKRSPNLMNSNSSSKSKNYLSENKITIQGNRNHKIYTPSPSNNYKERLSDRFIPMNKGTNLLEKFELARRWSAREANTTVDKDQKNNEADSLNTNMSNTYSHLLENNFFNKDPDYFTNDLTSKPSKLNSDTSTPIKSKIFSFRTEQKKKSHGLFSTSSGIINHPSNLETNNENLVNGSRKINIRPYKVLEAPGLLDDFYLNLVDWSSRNDLAVGQTNSVYLWCANKTQCVKLLSYEDDKYVSSVIWNPNGTEVAVGNSEGALEIWDGKY